MQNALRNSTRSSWLILTLLIALVGLSVSIRAKQVDRVLHASAPTTMTANADLPSPVLASVPHPLPIIGSRVAAPRTIAVQVPARAVSVRFAVRTLWYSVSVKHRPPPQYFA
jgi:hypothetical protein